MFEGTTRHELKFIITKSDYIVFQKKLDLILKKDIHSHGKPYTITSLYFDDINNVALYQKIRGDSYRYKYRIRYYNKEHTLFKLEKKEKIHQMTQKTSVTLQKHEVEQIVKGQYDFLKEYEEPLYAEFYHKLKNGLLRPKVIVEYERLAYIHKVGNVRITFDNHIKSSLFNCDIFDKDTQFTSILKPNEIVMEVKFDGNMPGFLRGILQVGKDTQTSLSKYVYSRQYNYIF